MATCHALIAATLLDRAHFHAEGISATKANCFQSRITQQHYTNYCHSNPNVPKLVNDYELSLAEHVPYTPCWFLLDTNTSSW